MRHLLILKLNSLFSRHLRPNQTVNCTTQSTFTSRNDPHSCGVMIQVIAGKEPGKKFVFLRDSNPFIPGCYYQLS